jgi:hypothetical protein
MPRTIVILSVLFLAGCSEAPATEPAGEAEGRVSLPGSQAGILWENGTYEATVTVVEVPGFGYHDQGECVVFLEDDVTKVVRGNVSASWDVSDPSVEEMHLVLSPGVGADWLVVSGPSPLSIELPAFDVEGRFLFGLKTTNELGVMARVPIHIDWNFLYDGAASPHFYHGGC